jgi:1-phosphofructokinase family hexose kinase
MILTVTLNSAVDKVLLLDELTPGRPMRAQAEVLCVGGKGLDVSVALHQIKVETFGLAFVAGATGRQLEALLLEQGLRAEMLWVAGETRTIYVLAEAKTKRVSHIKLGGLRLTEADLQRFLEAYRRQLPRATWVICSGSLPEATPHDFSAQLAREAATSGVPFLLDCPGEAMLAALNGPLGVAKLNWEEFETTFGVSANSLEDLAQAALHVTDRFQIGHLVLTCAAQGILAFTPQGSYHAIAPTQNVVNAAGAGDAVSGALAWRLSLGDLWPEALRWAAAAAAAVVRTPGTADCRWPDIQAIYPEVQVREDPWGEARVAHQQRPAASRLNFTGRP